MQHKKRVNEKVMSSKQSAISTGHHVKITDMHFNALPIVDSIAC